MLVHTESVLIPAPADRVFAYVCDPSNLCRWSVNFIFSCEPSSGGRHKVQTPVGPRELEFACNKEAGTIDLVFLQGPSVDFAVPTRVVAMGRESSLYLFTVMLPPQMPASEIEKAKNGLREELHLLREQVTAAVSA